MWLFRLARILKFIAQIWHTRDLVLKEIVIKQFQSIFICASSPPTDLHSFLQVLLQFIAIW